MNNRYVLQNGPDGITWCSLQPLMEDINENISKLMNMDITELSDDNKEIFELKILGLRTVYQFIGSLVQEKDLELLREEHNKEKVH
jgi:arginase family enzyme